MESNPQKIEEEDKKEEIKKEEEDKKCKTKRFRVTNKILFG